MGPWPDLLVAMAMQITASSGSNRGDAPGAGDAAPGAEAKADALCDAVAMPQLPRYSRTEMEPFRRRKETPMLCIKRSGKWLTRIFQVERPSLILVPYRLERL